MSLDMAKYLRQADAQLTRLGLYTTVTFEDVQEESSTYDPISGTYTESSSTNYTFSGVLLNTNYGDADNSYSVTAEMIVLPQYINFDVTIDQVYKIGDQRWQLINFKVAPQDSLYTLVLGRK